MKAALTRFLRSAEDLERLLSRSAIEEKILATDLSLVAPPELRQLLIEQRLAVPPFALRQAQYGMHLVLLYSALERFWEETIEGFVGAVNELAPKFNDLPKQIIDNHRRKTLDALRDSTWISRQGDPGLEKRLIENLHLCESGSPGYRLNSRVYARHAGNYRRGSLEEALRDVGVPSIFTDVIGQDSFRLYVQESPRTRGLLDGSLGAIDDLAERRNEIAHGDPSELLSLDDLRGYLIFFQRLAVASQEALRASLAELLITHHSVGLGHVADVHYKRVAELDLSVLKPGTRVELGNPLALRPKRKTQSCRLGKIANIRTEDGDTRSVRAEAGIRIAVEASFTIKPGDRLFLVNPAAPTHWLID